MIRFLAPALLLLMISCDAQSGPGASCIDDGDCGGLQVCEEFECVDVECLVTTDCPLEQTCDRRSFTCVEGCEVDDDCRAGFGCEESTSTCEPLECRSTELDCAFAENCNPATGACEPDGGGHCEPCSTRPFQAQGTCQDSRAICTTYFHEPELYCFLRCDEQADCPRGFECLNVGRDASGDGTIDHLCVAHCGDLYDNGWL
ncbi:MAG: hypothetical protein EA397_05375 [Deltaproteobacteria bacterium]|nr:MAG: hypothetical protein EA397_05375 [Deltaproteobacteria bacterium]